MTKKLLLILLILMMIREATGQSQSVKLVIDDGIADQVVKRAIEKNTSSLIMKLNEAFNRKLPAPDLENQGLTPNGRAKILELWKDRPFFCPAVNIQENLLVSSSRYQVRNIPVHFEKEDELSIVIEYLPDGRIDDFYVGLEHHQYKNVLDASSVTDLTRREIILNFLENLRTAYIKKDISYIEKLYSDKALIITGKVIRQESRSSDDFSSNFTKAQIEYQVQTKSEYIGRLAEVFRSINYLKLDFKEIEVMRHRKFPNFYGVTLEQIWNSSGYKDTGLLFLLIQFKEEEDPVIWVRTWQDATKTNRKDVFGLHNFKIATGQVVN